MTATASFTSGDVTVQSNTVTFNANVTPLTLSIVSGNNQSGLVNVPLAPFVVSVTNGGAVAGASITWTITQGTGTLVPPSPTTTGGNGLSETTLTPTAGSTCTVTARASFTSGGATVQSNTVTFTCSVSPLTLSIVSGNNQSGLLNVPLAPFVVSVTNGGAVAGASITWTITQRTGTLVPSSPTTTGSNGLSQMTLTPTGGSTFTVTASASFTSGGATVQSNLVTFTASVTPLTLSIVSGNNQSGVLGVPLGAPFVVSVTNSGAVAGASITWTITQGTGTLVPPSPTTTGGDGLSRTTLTPTAGSTVTVTATASFTSGGATVQSNTVTFTCSAAPLTLSIVSGNNQSGLLNVPLGAPFVVSVTNGGAVAGASITWTITQGTARWRRPARRRPGAMG